MNTSVPFCLHALLALCRKVSKLIKCQIHGELRAFVKERIKQKLVAFEGDAKASKTRSVMKWWLKCISIAIAKTASRNVAFKVAKIL